MIGRQFWLDPGGRGVLRAELVAEEFVQPFRARLRLVAELRNAADPTSHAAGWRTQNWRMSDIVADAAPTACAVPTFDAGILTESGVGNTTMTMLSQNAARTRNHMTLLRVFHDFFIAVVDTVVESIEGEVGPVLWIFRMFEPNLRRVFLTFERFSSLRKRCRVTRHCGQSACKPCHNCASKARSRRRDRCDARADNSFGSPCRRLHSATDRSPCGAIRAA